MFVCKPKRALNSHIMYSLQRNLNDIFVTDNG